MKHFKTLFLVGIVVLFCVTTLFSQGPDTLWTKTFGGAFNEEGRSVQQTTDGGYIIAGYTKSFGAGGQDCYLIKTDPNGDTLWSKSYGGTIDDRSYSVQQTADGGYIIAGCTWSFGAGVRDIYLIKTDPNGDTSWTKTYGGVNHEEGYSVEQTTDGGYIIAGFTKSFGVSEQDYYLIKTDPNGDTLWTKTYGGANNDYGYSVEHTTDGGYIITGFTNSFGAGGWDIYLVKTDSLGNTLWTKTYGGTDNDLGRSVQQSSDGGYIITGYTKSFGAGYYDAYLIKTDSIGDTLWTKTYGGGNDEFGWSVRQSPDGGYIVIGTKAFGSGNFDFYLIKTDANGDTLWTKTCGGAVADSAYSIQHTSDGGYIIAGFTNSFGAGGADAYLIKTNPIKILSPNGGEVWVSSSTHNLLWWCENMVGNSYCLLFSNDGGNSYPDTIATGVSQDSLSWSCILPNIHCSTCRVKIQILDAVNSIISEDASDSNFSVIDTTSPIPFNLISPSDSAFLPITRPTFVWETSFDSTSGLEIYEVYVNDTSRYSLIDTMWTANYDLDEGYSDWYVVTYDSAANSRQSTETWTVIIDTTFPSTVSLILPSDGEYLNNSTINFIWNKASDNFGIDHYILQYALDTGFTVGLVETTVVDTSFITTLSDTIYYWHIRAVDYANNIGDWSSVWSFTLDTQAPDAPILICPVGGIYLTDTLVSFEWNQVLFTKNPSKERNILKNNKEGIRLAPVRYTLELDTTDNFISPVLVDTFDTTNTILILAEDFYYWRVQAFDLAGNESPYSGADSFGLDVTPPLIDSTTLWSDTSYAGPFPVYAKVTDISPVDTVMLYYRREEDPAWFFTGMTAGTNNWYVGEIPYVYLQNDTVKYYIFARDKGQFESTDPPGAPASYYWFIANMVGIEEPSTKPVKFTFQVNSPVKEKAIFRFSLPERSRVSIKIYDVTGRLISKPISGNYGSGIYKVTFKPPRGGIYFYKLESPYKNTTGKLIIF